MTALNNNDQTAVSTAQGGLSGVSQYLNQQLAFYGTTQDSVSAATDSAASQQVEFQSQISNLQDTDTAATILDLTQSQTEEQAALGSEGQIPRTTLFDFLG